MNFKANYEAVLLSGSSNTFSYSTASPPTGSTIHQLFCLSSGSINITALGGGSFIWSASAGQSIDVVVGSVTVTSGVFVGFKVKFFPSQYASSNYTF